MLLESEAEPVSMEDVRPKHQPPPTLAAEETTQAANTKPAPDAANNISPFDMVKELDNVKAELSALKESKAKDDARLAALERAEARRTSRREMRSRHRTLS